jgi:hypothetical protein
MTTLGAVSEFLSCERICQRQEEMGSEKLMVEGRRDDALFSPVDWPELVLYEGRDETNLCQ